MTNEELALQEKKQPRSRRFLIIVIVAGAVIALDQWTKWWVIQNIPLNASWLPDSMQWLEPYARLLHIKNTGASFGMFQNANLLFILLTVLIVAGILYYAYTLEDSSTWMWAVGGLYLGGAIGNLVDRLILGAVTDFVSVGSFYIFNVADASINVSVALVIVLWISEQRQSKPALPAEAEGTHE